MSKNKYQVISYLLSVSKYEAPASLRSGYLLPSLRRERNPSEAENSSHSVASLRSRFSAKGDKLKLLNTDLLSTYLIRN